MNGKNVRVELDRFAARDRAPSRVPREQVILDISAEQGRNQLAFFARQMRNAIKRNDVDAEGNAREVRGSLLTLLAANIVPTARYRDLDRHLNDVFIALNQENKAAALVNADLFLEAL